MSRKLVFVVVLSCVTVGSSSAYMVHHRAQHVASTQPASLASKSSLATAGGTFVNKLGKIIDIGKGTLTPDTAHAPSSDRPRQEAAAQEDHDKEALKDLERRHQEHLAEQERAREQAERAAHEQAERAAHAEQARREAQERAKRDRGGEQHHEPNHGDKNHLGETDRHGHWQS